MQITIDVDNAKMEEIVSEGVNELPKETLASVAQAAIAEFLKDKGVVESLVFESVRRDYYYGNTVVDYDRPRQWFKDMISSAFSSEEVEKYRKIIFDTIENETPKVLEKAITRCFADMLLDCDLKKRITKALGG